MDIWYRAIMASAPAAGGGFDPLTIPGLQAWWDASNAASRWQDVSGTTPAAADSDPVGRLDDLTGNGHHLLVHGSENARRPLYKAALAAGAGLLFDGVNDVLTTGSVPAWTQPIQVLLVYRGVSHVAGTYVASGEGIVTYEVRTTPATLIYAGSNLSHASTAGYPDPALVTYAMAGVASYIRVDGVEVVAGDGGAGYNPSGLSIGGGGAWAGGGNNTNIELYAAGVVKPPLTGTDLTDVETAIINHWGL